MANTVSQDKHDEEYREIIDPPALVSDKVTQLAGLIHKHRGNVVVYTGAGISTGAGIPDFRSGLGSVTGMPAGKWCQDATRNQWTETERQDIDARNRRTTSCLQAIPTPSHMALVALQRCGVLKGLISQNCDGLHRRSGFDPEVLAELHGNTNLEYCGWCGREYVRDFRATTGRHTKGAEMRRTLWPKHRHLDLINPRRGRHYTGRRCLVPGCEGYLFDSTIAFGDNLPEKHINRGYQLAAEAGLCIVLGSRCSVSPACDMPISVGESGRPLVVVNLQRTAADEHATLRIGAKIDDVMVPLMKLLGVDIPRFTLRRRVCIENRPPTGSGGPTLTVRAVDADGLPVDLLWNVQARYRPAHVGGDDPFAGTVRKGLVRLNQDALKRLQNTALAPGDTGRVQTWPWENVDHPGYVDVEFLAGKKTRFVPADHCDVVDGFHPAVSGDVVVDAASLHGATLAHEIPMPAAGNQLEGLRLQELTLMFRAHYGEVPVVLPVPALGTTAIHTLDYDPVQRVWLVGTNGSDMRTAKEAQPIDTHTAFDTQEDRPKPTASQPIEVSEKGDRFQVSDDAVRLRIDAREEVKDGKYRCFHEVSVTTAVPGRIAAVTYSAPRQGFRHDSRTLTAPPFTMKYGPCWGRPHVTVDLEFSDGTMRRAVFEDNLPRRSVEHVFPPCCDG